MRKVILSIVNAVSVLVIAMAVLVLLSALLTESGRAPSVFGCSVFRVTTGSMEPAIPVNSLVVVRKIDPCELKVGDVISFYSRDPLLDNMVNTHRIAAIAQEGQTIRFTTRGDANNVDDPYETTQEELIGKVIVSSYRLGLLVRLVSNPLLFVPLILGPLAVMLVIHLRQTVSLAKQIAREEEQTAVKEALEEIRRRREEANETT